MNESETAKHIEVDSLRRLFKAMADETRLRVLHLLTAGELCVCDLMRVLELPQSTVSRHMAYLRNSGWVNDRRQGVWIYYSLAEPSNCVHEALLKCVRECLSDCPSLKQDQQRLTHCSKG